MHRALLLIGVLFASPSLAAPCQPGKPAGTREYWSWRLIDGRACWYRGPRGLSKAALWWPPVPAPPAPAAALPSAPPATSFVDRWWPR